MMFSFSITPNCDLHFGHSLTELSSIQWSSDLCNDHCLISPFDDAVHICWSVYIDVWITVTDDECFFLLCFCLNLNVVSVRNCFIVVDCLILSSILSFFSSSSSSWASSLSGSLYSFSWSTAAAAFSSRSSAATSCVSISCNDLHFILLTWYGGNFGLKYFSSAFLCASYSSIDNLYLLPVLVNNDVVDVVAFDIFFFVVFFFFDAALLCICRLSNTSGGPFGICNAQNLNEPSLWPVITCAESSGCQSLKVATANDVIVFVINDCPVHIHANNSPFNVHADIVTPAAAIISPVTLLIATDCIGDVCPSNLCTNCNEFKSQIIIELSFEPLTIIRYSLEYAKHVISSVWPYNLLRNDIVAWGGRLLSLRGSVLIFHTLTTDVVSPVNTTLPSSDTPTQVICPLSVATNSSNTVTNSPL